MRVDRRCWARSIYQDRMLWGFKGIANPPDSSIRRFTPKKSSHAQVVLCDERYVDDLHYTEAKYVATDSNWLEDWREYVEAHLHNAECCPHENKQNYDAAVARMFNDTDERMSWARERVDHDWIRDSIESHFQDEESVFYFLKDHPVDSVWLKNAERWEKLVDVVGFCPSCDEALVEEHRDTDKGSAGTSHPFDKDCQDPFCESGASLCLYDEHGVLRDLFICSTCNWSDVTQDVEGDETFYSKYGRPFNWPPGAPYPPRRSFSGFPMDVPPYED